MSDPLVSRMRAYERSIFGELSAMATELHAVNLGQGFPDTGGPTQVREAALAAIGSGLGDQYPPAHGLPDLRAAISEHQARFYGLSVDSGLGVVVATGASEAIAAAVLALVEPGQEVMLFDPYFDLYAAVIALAGARRVTVPLTADALRPDVAAMRAAVTPATRVLLLNSPHNPTGVVFTREELSELAAFAHEHDLLVIADEAYEHLWFDDNDHVPIATLPGMFDRTVTIGSGGKSFSFTGWKVGWATGPPDLIGAVRVVRQHLSYVSGGPFQYAMATGLRLPDDYFDAFRADLTAKRDRLCEGLSDLGLRVIPPQGTYFATTDVRPIGFTDGEEYCRRLPREAGVVAIPQTALSDHPGTTGPYVRWAFCKQPAVLDEALVRLQRWLGHGDGSL
ncbi:MAG: aminotransferase class I/II-fold pyridoxal phosphate-dependent enzyme [Candidatus Nanopelagicales bacterium]